MQTVRQVHGRRAEDVAADYVERLGWRVVARNFRVGARDEIDIVAIDPGPPGELVCVEVRSAASEAFGAPEERIDRRKVGNLYRAMRTLDVQGHLPRRVDLVVVDLRGPRPAVRHLRHLAPA